MKFYSLFLFLLICVLISVSFSQDKTTELLKEKCKLKVSSSKGTWIDLTAGTVILTDKECTLVPDKPVPFPNFNNKKAPVGLQSVNLENIIFNVPEIHNISVNGDTLKFNTSKDSDCDKHCLVVTKKADKIKNKFLSLLKNNK